MTQPTRVEHDVIEIVQAKHPEDMTPEASHELANDGGAVGFAFPLVSIADARPAADQLIASARPGDPLFPELQPPRLSR